MAIKRGESVTWTNPPSGRAEEGHNIVFEDGRFKNPAVPTTPIPADVKRTFDAEGAYRYYCENHGSPGGIGMFGFVYVNASGELPPQAKFIVETDPAVAGRPVTFNAGASSATNSAIAKYEWDLNGNGMYGDPQDKTTTTPTVSQTYLLAQEVDVRLRVTDGRGATDVLTRSLSIGPPLPDPAPAPQPGPSPAPNPSPAAPTPIITAPAPGPTPPAPSATSSRFTFSAPRTVRRSKGAPLAVTCAARCRFTATLSVSTSVARKARLGRKATTIGTARGTLGAAGTKRATVKLTAKARKRTARLKSLRATLKLAVVDASGKTSRKQKSITLKR